MSSWLVSFGIGCSLFWVLPEFGVGTHPLRVSKGVAIYLELKVEKVVEKRESKKKRGAASKEGSINIDLDV